MLTRSDDRLSLDFLCFSAMIIINDFESICAILFLSKDKLALIFLMVISYRVRTANPL